MAGQSKPEEGAAKKNPLSVLGPAIFLSVFCFASTLPLRPMLLTDVLGDSAAVSSTLARLTASGALSEFIFTPAFGRLMDTYGRKMFLIVALLTSACANGMLFLNSGSLKWWLVEGCVRKAADTVFFTAVRTTLVDCLAHDLPELTISAARMAVFAGVGVMFGPIFTQRLLLPMVQQQAKYAFAVNVGILGATAAFIAACLGESLDKDQRKPMNWAAANPLSFISLLKSSRTMFLLMLTSGLQTCIDGYNIVESNFIYQRDQLNFSPGEQSNYLTFAGVKIIMGGLLGKPLMRNFGQLGLTTFSNFANFIAQAIGMLATGPLGMYGHVLATGFGERKRDGVETLLTAEAEEKGFGRGQTAAGMSNFRSIPNIIAPLLYAAAYNRGVLAGFPKALFLARMIVGAVLPELTFRMIPTKDRKRLAGPKG